MPTAEEREKERKFKVNFKIESEVNAARLRQEKADEKAEKKAVKSAPVPKSSGTLSKVGGFIKERSIAIAHETGGAPRQNYNASVPGFGDPFGMGSVGSVNPFAPPRPEPAPRRKRRKPKPTRAPPRRQSSGGGGMNMMGGIPKHMRWMF